MAGVIGVAQETVSRIENGARSLSLEEWFRFVEFSGVSFDAAATGRFDIIDKNSTAKLPFRYRNNAFSTVRTFRIFWDHLLHCNGTEKANEWLDSRGISQDFMFNMSNPLSLQANSDLIYDLHRLGRMSGASLAALVKPVSGSSIHGSVGFAYELAKGPVHALELFIEHSSRYEQNFRYSIESKKPGLVDFGIAPNEHIKDVDFRGLGPLHCDYKKAFFKSFLSTRGAPKAEVIEPECFYRGDKRCLYQVTMT